VRFHGPKNVPESPQSLAVPRNGGLTPLKALAAPAPGRTRCCKFFNYRLDGLLFAGWMVQPPKVEDGREYGFGVMLSKVGNVQPVPVPRLNAASPVFLASIFHWSICVCASPMVSKTFLRRAPSCQKSV